MKRASVFLIALLILAMILPLAKAEESPGPLWVKSYGGSGDDVAYAVVVADNGDIIVAGITKSFSAGKKDVWVFRLDKNGNVKWQKTYSGSDYDIATSVAIALNGDIIVAGYYGARDLFGSEANVWVLRLDENGNVNWQKTYGGSKNDYANSIAIAPNGDVF
ncbi:hypothetical protein [Thermococcus cleftensis]|uniref:hypothetical protein n=1 Tax=Thermococcus cleftensis (strain DSM 27260 / KACC 17922 / CL1) TaxID=163003 RepID=UPI0006950E33|nr:hypothetical protein [Thermococcus cleftensis]